MDPGNTLGILFRNSWQASVLILLVLALQWVCGRRLTPRWRYALWMLVVARLATPWSLPSHVSLFNWLSLPKQHGPSIIAVGPEPRADAESQRANTAPEETEPGTVASRTHDGVWSGLEQSPLAWALVIWGAGAALLVAYLGWAHYRLFRRVAGRRPLIDADTLNLFEDCKSEMGVQTPVTLIETEEIGSPALFGFVRPRLLLPRGLTMNFSRAELRHVFLHELGHIKRNDILVSWCTTALQIAHWFNPFVWLAFHRMRVDRELACDALALSYARGEESQPYGRTIIKLLEQFGRSAWAPSVAGALENKNQLKERISMIAKFKQTSRWPAFALSVFAGLAVITLTDAQTPPQAEAQTAPAVDEKGPPGILATSPKIAAADVDPGLTEVTVTFDRDMEPGFSWTGSGPDYPTIPKDKKVAWRDKRTCVLPVKLEAGHYYRVGINSKSYRNFRSVAGVSALPSAIYFTTWGASGEEQMKTLTPEVVSCEPLNGVENVNPALTELRVTFNVPMGGGFSWCGSGPEYPSGPEGRGPYWTEDHRTCVLPVELKPGATYKLWLNSPSHNNFQSAAGVQLKPVEYTFKTLAQ